MAEWLGTVLPRGTELRFDAPDSRWGERPSGPLMVDVFLHGIQQDSAGRSSTWSDVRDADGRVIGRQPPVRHFRLTYLLTAWATADGLGTDPGAGHAGRSRSRSSSGGDSDSTAGAGVGSDVSGPSARTVAEHEALGLILSASSQTETLPPACVKGVLAESGLPTMLLCAPPETSEPAGAVGVWAGLGVAPRACVQLVIVAPLRPPMVVELAPPAREIVLNAWQEQPSDSAGGSSMPSHRLEPGPALGAARQVRRWERETRNEPPAPLRYNDNQ